MAKACFIIEKDGAPVMYETEVRNKKELLLEPLNTYNGKFVETMCRVLEIFEQNPNKYHCAPPLDKQDERYADNKLLLTFTNKTILMLVQLPRKPTIIVPCDYKLYPRLCNDQNTEGYDAFQELSHSQFLKAIDAIGLGSNAPKKISRMQKLHNIVRLSKHQ